MGVGARAVNLALGPVGHNRRHCIGVCSHIDYSVHVFSTLQCLLIRVRPTMEAAASCVCSHLEEATGALH